MTDGRGGLDPAADADPMAPPAAPLHPPAPSPLVPVTQEIERRPVAVHKAETAGTSRRNAGLVAAGLAAAAGVAVVARRRATH